VVQVEQSAAAVRAMLGFMYTGQVDGAALAAAEDLRGALDLAAQHNLEGLLAACEQQGVAMLSEETVVPLAAAAHLHELPALQAACAAFTLGARQERVLLGQPLEVDIVEYWLGQGANPNTRCGLGLTALGRASIQGNRELCLLYLSHGADLLAVMPGSTTALDLYGLESHELLPKQKVEGCIAMIAAALKCKDATMAKLQVPASATAKLLFSDDFSDLVFACGGGGGRLSAHKCLLAAGSEHMGAWLMANGEDVQVEQSCVAVCAMLRFMYTGQVDGAALAADLGGVLALATQHGLQGLHEACHEFNVQCQLQALWVQQGGDE